MKPLLPLLTLLLWVGGCAPAQNDPASATPMSNEPILSGHSHNDYLHQRPLWEAISYAFASLEVDSHANRSTISVPALRILGRLAEQHFVAILAALERQDADAGELRQLRETLDALESEAGA